MSTKQGRSWRNRSCSNLISRSVDTNGSICNSQHRRCFQDTFLICYWIKALPSTWFLLMHTSNRRSMDLRSSKRKAETSATPTASPAAAAKTARSKSSKIQTVPSGCPEQQSPKSGQTSLTVRSGPTACTHHQ